MLKKFWASERMHSTFPIVSSARRVLPDPDARWSSSLTRSVHGSGMWSVDVASRMT
jgi:hypothetical protein